MSRPPAHLSRLAVQHAHTKLKQRNTSHAIPTDYRDVEMSERMTLQAFLGDSRGKPYATGEHWNHLAACRNVLLFGAGHMREQAKLRGEDPQPFIDILALCNHAKESMLAIRRREQKTGKFGLSGDDRIYLAQLVDASAQFWKRQPAWFFRDCVNADLKMGQNNQEKEGKAA